MDSWIFAEPRELDLERAGIRRYALSLAYRQDGREGAIRLPVVVARQGRGPAVLVAGGTHGDEFEGQTVVADLIRSLEGGGLTGTIVALPLLNLPACLAGERCAPADPRDLNRLFGQPPAEGPTGAIARFVETALLPRVDWVIDLHSGGIAHEFVLSANLQARTGTAECAAMLPALLAFDAPYAIVFDEAGELAMPHAGTLEGLARAMGKKAISSEVGGAGRATPASLVVAERGLRNLLAHIGVRRHPLASAAEGSRSRLVRLDRPEHHVASPATGRIAPRRWLGDAVSKDELIGFIHPLEAPAAGPVPIRSTASGIVVAVPGRGLQRAGAPAFFVAEPMKRASAAGGGVRRRIRAHETELQNFPMQAGARSASNGG